MGQTSAYEVFIGKTHGKSRRRLENNIKMDLRETGCKDGKWMKLVQDRVQYWTYILPMSNFLILLPEG
jgi:hypothetical protein